MAEIQHKDKIIKIIEIFYPHAKIYLFGSQDAKRYFTRGRGVEKVIDKMNKQLVKFAKI